MIHFLEAAIMQERFYCPGMDLGVGVNLLTGDALHCGIVGTLTPPFAQGQKVESKIMRIDDISTLHKALGIDVSASGSFMGFSASAKLNYADSCGFNEHSTYLLVSIVVTNALSRMDNPELTTEAAELLKNQKPDRFRERFGDVFVAGIHTGGEYFAIFQITGTDESEKESLATKVNASFNSLAGGASLGVEINTATQSSHSHLSMKTLVYQNGGSDTTNDATPDQIMAKAHNFAPSLAGESGKYAVAYSIFPESYRTLNLPGDAANLIDIENQKEMLATNFQTRNELMVLVNNIDYILFSNAQNHDEFEAFDVDALTAERNRLAGAIDTITREASACMRDAQSCHLATMVQPSKPLPKRKIALIGQVQIPDWAGHDVRMVQSGEPDQNGERLVTPGELGLQLQIVKGADAPDAGDAGQVISVTPAPGTSVPRGSWVTVSIYA